MVKSPFHIKKYDCYDSYLAHQCSKLNKKLATPTGKVWLERHEKVYYEFVKIVLKSLAIKSTYDYQGKNCLCVGARGESEVRAFIDMGCIAIGIDLYPTPNNCYVVTGDVARIQYNENSFDIVYTNALDHFLLIDQSLQNIKRVLRPDGMFLLVTGTPDGAKDDLYASTYWDSEEALETYLHEKHKFNVIAKISIKQSTGGWFSHIVVLSNKKDAV